MGGLGTDRGTGSVVLAWLEIELGIEVQGGPGEEREVFSAGKGGKSDVTLSIT